MTTPHVASTNEAILEAQARQLEQADRYLDECLAAFRACPPFDLHRNKLVAAIDAHVQLRIRDKWRDAEAVRTLR